MRSSPSGRQIPNEIVRYTIDLAVGSPTPDVGTRYSPPYMQPLVVNPILALFAAVPGSLGLGSLLVLSGGGGSGPLISCQFQLVTIVAGVPVFTNAGTPFTIDPGAPAGAVGTQIDMEDVVIPDTGAGLLLQVTIPAGVNVPAVLSFGVALGVFWKDSTLRNPLGG